MVLATTTLTFAADSDISEESAGPKAAAVTTAPPRFIAHGGATVYGLETSSSLEALNKAIEQGFTYIELDMEFSADGKIIMLHDWDRTTINYLGRKFTTPLTCQEFEKQLICGRLTPLTFDRLVPVLKEHPEVRIVIDTKADVEKLLTKIATEYEEVLPQMVPQIYDYDQYEMASSLGYSDIILTLYQMHGVTAEQLINFTKTHRLLAITLPTDYWTKNLPAKLKAAGIRAYTHPVDSLEEAIQQFSKGAYGAYVSNLMPEDIEGYNGEYYLLQTTKSGKAVKLTDVTLGDSWIRSVKIHGNLSYKAFKYKLDGRVLEEALEEISDSPSEKHLLEIEVWNIEKGGNLGEQPVYTMEYYLAKNDGKCRIVDKRYEYRLDELRDIPYFQELREAFMKEKGLEDEDLTGVRGALKEKYEKAWDLLSESFLCKAGNYIYYSKGEGRRFLVGKDVLQPQRANGGQVLAPMADMFRACGIYDFRMDAGRYVHVNYGGETWLMQTYSTFLKRGISNTNLEVPTTMYRSKVLAGGELVEKITGASYIDCDGLLVVLPSGISGKDLSEEEKEAIIELGSRLV